MRSQSYAGVVCSIFLSWVCFGLLEFAAAGDEDNEKAKGPNALLKEAILSGESTLAMAELKKLPKDDRQAWISQIHQRLSEADRNGVGANGGGAIANYNDLIQLIENTIDAEWASQGGTASIIPYRNGVRIDPKGVIERFDPTKSLAKLRVPKSNGDSNRNSVVSLEKLGDWQEATPLRWVSLHQLDQQVAERLAGNDGVRANVSMELIAGLYRIDYIAFEPESNEWFLGGPAGGLVITNNGDLLHRETRLPPLLLEDLLSIAPHILNGKGELGCTIDPDAKRLAEAHAMVQSPASLKGLQKNPEGWVEQWRQKLGLQHTKVIGLSQDSPTGYAMLVADAHMKRLALELEPCPPNMRSYWQEKDIFGTPSNAPGLIRFWFSATDHKIPTDPDRHIYHFASSNVEVLSESQMMNASGDRVQASVPDIAADAFARSFSRNFAAIQNRYPVYGRLRHIVDLSVAMEIVRSEIQSGRGKAFTALGQLSVQPKMDVPPLEIESVAATHKLPEGAMSAVVSGGVSIQLRDVRSRLKVDRANTNKVDLERSNSPSHASEHVLTKEMDSFRDKPFWR